MVFSDETVEAAWNRAGGECECKRTSHPEHHGKDCKKELVKENRGREGRGKWEAHHKDGNPNNDFLSNCEILCWECHKLTI